MNPWPTCWFHWLTTLAILYAVTAAAAAPAATAPNLDDLGGHIEARSNGQTLLFPTLKTDIDADIQGDLATVTVIQTFANPLTTPLNATYLFPLNEQAAVYEMTMEVGDEVVHARIQRVEEARQTFAQAQREGKSAALLTQHRPNMFTQDIANLMPGLPIRVTLRYVQTVPRVDGAYELVTPLVVGPRFQPPGAGVEQPDAGPEARAPAKAGGEGGVARWNLDNPPAAAGGATITDSRRRFGRWELESLPAYPPVAGMEIPDQIDPERVALRVRIDGGMPIASVESPTHAIKSESRSSHQRTITLATGRTIDNRDFVLRYTLAGATNQAGLLAYRDERGGFFSLLLEPPAAPAEAAITPREMVFVLDCSGSMAGLPIQASKAFMRRALQKLRPTDTFRIIRFSDATTEFSAQPLPATLATIQQGLVYTNQLNGEGGTMMTTGILQALQAPAPSGRLRLVIFLTDGYIGNEAQVLELTQQHLGSARLFAFGVGAGVNRYLLGEMGRVGRGFTRYMDPTENVDRVVEELTERLQSPTLTDIHMDWGELAPRELTPALLPDLFAGQSLRIQGRYAKPGTYAIRIEGLVNGRRASLPLEVQLPAQSDSGPGVALIWARSAIADIMNQLITPAPLRAGQVTDSELKERATQLGLEFSLVTQWTSLVAVSTKVHNSTPEGTPTRPVLLPQVRGVSHLAYGNPTTPTPSALSSQAPAVMAYSNPSLPRAVSGNTGTFGGEVAPEPETVFGLAAIGGLLAWFARRRMRT